MTTDILITIGICTACFFGGGALSNFLVHLNYSFFFDKLPERFQKSRATAYISTHLGNVLMALSSLALGLFLPALAGYELGLNPSTLFLFLGFSAPALKNAWVIDRREKAAGAKAISE